MGGFDLDSRSNVCGRLGGEVGPPLGVVVEEVAVLLSFDMSGTFNLFKSLKRTSPPKLSTISPNPSKPGVQLVHGTDTDPAEVLLTLGVPVSES